jgi:hypothetical protein
VIVPWHKLPFTDFRAVFTSSLYMSKKHPSLFLSHLRFRCLPLQCSMGARIMMSEHRNIHVRWWIIHVFIHRCQFGESSTLLPIVMKRCLTKRPTQYGFFVIVKLALMYFTLYSICFHAPCIRYGAGTCEAVTCPLYPVTAWRCAMLYTGTERCWWTLSQM